MTLRCRPGDLAVVIRGSACGAFVDVIELYVGPMDDPPTWECHTKGPCLVALVSPYTMRIVGEKVVPPGTTVMFKDRDLQPIRPPKKRLSLPVPPVTMEN